MVGITLIGTVAVLVLIRVRGLSWRVCELLLRVLNSYRASIVVHDSLVHVWLLLLLGHLFVHLVVLLLELVVSLVGTLLAY